MAKNNLFYFRFSVSIIFYFLRFYFIFRIIFARTSYAATVYKNLEIGDKNNA
jgi:hypothetical protein